MKKTRMLIGWNRSRDMAQPIRMRIFSIRKYFSFRLWRILTEYPYLCRKIELLLKSIKKVRRLSFFGMNPVGHEYRDSHLIGISDEEEH